LTNLTLLDGKKVDGFTKYGLHDPGLKVGRYRLKPPGMERIGDLGIGLKAGPDFGGPKALPKGGLGAIHLVIEERARKL